MSQGDSYRYKEIFISILELGRLILIAIIKAAGGLGFFLYGMHITNDGLKKIADRRLYRLIEKTTRTSILAFITGAISTVILQSSSLVTVMVVGLANAGVISLKQGIGVIIGANVGTTVTGQIISFSPTEAAFPLIVIGFLFLLFAPQVRAKATGEAILGFGFLLAGLRLVTQSLYPLVNSPLVSSFLAIPLAPLEGIIAGSILTAVIQSSSLIIGLVISLAINYEIGLSLAVALILGADLGTCVTSLLAAWGGNQTARRVAAAHFLFNFISIILILPLFSYFVSFVSATSPVLSHQIANAHTLYNFFGAALLLPLYSVISHILEIIIRD